MGKVGDKVKIVLDIEKVLIEAVAAVQEMSAV
jgi:hypothetical protein